MQTSKLALLALCEGNPPVTGGFPSQRASNAEVISILLDHDDYDWLCYHEIPPVSTICSYIYVSSDVIDSINIDWHCGFHGQFTAVNTSH